MSVDGDSSGCNEGGGSVKVGESSTILSCCLLTHFSLRIKRNHILVVH